MPSSHFTTTTRSTDTQLVHHLSIQGGNLHTLLSSGEVGVPAKLAGFDMWGFLLRLSPELRVLVASVASAVGVGKGLLDSTALFVVAFLLFAPRMAAMR